MNYQMNANISTPPQITLDESNFTISVDPQNYQKKICVKKDLHSDSAKDLIFQILNNDTCVRKMHEILAKLQEENKIRNDHTRNQIIKELEGILKSQISFDSSLIKKM
ncbi:MAG: hypothetical protein MAG458_01156 [Nitrosopumilus sp.]|nr:hypothetical protein [Nitrosopumilus sp.]